MSAAAQFENFYYYKQDLIWKFRAAVDTGQKGHFFEKALFFLPDK